MNIFISGGLGYVGRHLSNTLLQDGHTVTAVGRRDNPANMIQHSNFSYLAADTTKPGDWQASIPTQDVVINLTGRSIFTLWTAGVKKDIYDSRILTTRNIAEALQDSEKAVFFSTSAIGYYGERGDDTLTEEEPPGDDFLATVSKDWEYEAMKVPGHIRVVIPRFGIVLSNDGGAMAKMLPAFKFFLGGRLGSGRQWFPWIHLQDLVAAYRFAIADGDIIGPANWCAPNPVRNEELTRKLAEKLKRPVMLPAPGFMVKTLLGDFGKTLLCSQRAEPAVLQKAGYPFSYPTLDSALDEIVKK
ncbi:MAG: TIGR01777 family oxidoreductase [Desulfocapsaceae bacterium]|nr:TIGR01777 family oxidoreductase [Desulfocapsaceae bacterium]